ncbi:MAG: hypothetical protein PHE24_07065 [Patescibacteria group bacterium]|nr:hypothetical protein [Patescibacteria group bacterium]
MSCPEQPENADQMPTRGISARASFFCFNFDGCTDAGGLLFFPSFWTVA